jgi:hypothetical protein
MGMFDRIYCTYDLGPGFYLRALQTKSMECIDYTGTQDFVDTSAVPGDWDGFKVQRNGNHGKISPYDFTGDIEVYPEKWDCKYAAFPRQTITFNDGQLCTKT